MKCPKCGTYMERAMKRSWLGKWKPWHYVYCPDCGHEEKVKP